MSDETLPPAANDTDPPPADETVVEAVAAVIPRGFAQFELGRCLDHVALAVSRLQVALQALESLAASYARQLDAGTEEVAPAE